MVGAGEFSFHLMSDTNITKKQEYKQFDDENDLVILDQDCPWKYPTVNHPNTLLLWKGYQNDP
tara:strand:+ start:208 stop:396 length:189 start_codon:yes stop_codon:yes gene_type:complete